MEKAAEVLMPPQPDKVSPPLDPESSEGDEAAAGGFPSSFDHMEEFHRRLEDIISTYGSAAGLLDKQSVVDTEMEKMKEEAKGDITVSMDTEVSLIMNSLNQLPSPEKKLEDLVRKYAEMAGLRRSDQQRLCVLQQKLSVLLEERQQLQAERRSSITARRELETLCRELQSHYNAMREETLRRCKEDEEKRKEITSHFQEMLTEIQTQIEQHSTRNDKLCRENTHLTDKLEGLMNQCERREESLEKINRHRDLQLQLTEAKLQQANALLAEAEDKHKREKEYLLREAIDKTKKCFAMKEQELAMKKKLTLYAEKFDEFQATLAKSNEIYVRFKKEMDVMSGKMKKMEVESNLWKTRFENCNKALTDMIEERTEKAKEYDLFVLKIQKLEKLCRALQEERVALYEKIKEVRRTNANIPAKCLGFSNSDDNSSSEGAEKSAHLTAEELQELQELQKDDPVLTEDMNRLKEEQAKLQEFAASLLAPPSDDEKEEKDDVDLEEDVVASAFGQFRSKTLVKQDVVSAPEQVENVKSKAAEPDVPLPVIVEEVENPVVPTLEAPTPEQKPATIMPDPNQKVQTQEVPTPEQKPATIMPDPNLKVQTQEAPTPEQKPATIMPDPNQKVQTQEAPTPEQKPATIMPDPNLKVQTPVEAAEVQQVQPSEEVQQQQPVKPAPEPEKAKVDPPTEPEATKAEIVEETGEVKPVVIMEEQKAQQQPAEPEEAPKASEPAAPPADTPQPAASSEVDSSKKQAPKKKKKRNGKNAS